MIDKLKQVGFGRIAIADDTEENIYAAKQLEERLPGIQFEFYRRGDILVAQIPNRYKELGLILTDRQMETDDAGLDVVQAGWSYLIPTFVCSGGYQHRNQPLVRVAPEGFTTPAGMTKDSPDTWYKIIEHIADNAIGENGKLIKSLLRARKVGLKVPFESSGEQARSIAQGYLDRKPTAAFGYDQIGDVC